MPMFRSPEADSWPQIRVLGLLILPRILTDTIHPIRRPRHILQSQIHRLRTAVKSAGGDI